MNKFVKGTLITIFSGASIWAVDTLYLDQQTKELKSKLTEDGYKPIGVHVNRFSPNTFSAVKTDGSVVALGTDNAVFGAAKPEYKQVIRIR